MLASSMSGMANAPVWLISQSEAQLLAGLIGRRLERIRFDGEEASLEFDSCTLVAYPVIGTGSSPMFPNKEEIMRLSVRPVTAEESARLCSSRHVESRRGAVAVASRWRLAGLSPRRLSPV